MEEGMILMERGEGEMRDERRETMFSSQAPRQEKTSFGVGSKCIVG